LQSGKEKDGLEESFKKMFWRPVKSNKIIKEKGEDGGSEESINNMF